MHVSTATLQIFIFLKNNNKHFQLKRAEIRGQPSKEFAVQHIE